jgi:acetyl-CoA acyltransferase
VTSAFLYAATRTPFGKFGGALAGVRPDDLAAVALEPQDFGFAPVEPADQAPARAGIAWADVSAVELNEASGQAPAVVLENVA